MEGTLTRKTRCCVVGGGPAGMMLGLLLARAGVDVVVLEKHGDFLRDFRGDTIHPSTLELMHELGWLNEFLALPHQRVERLALTVGDEVVPGPDFSGLPTHCKFIALMPQWDFLDFVAGKAARYPGFHLEMDTEATELVEEGGCVLGVRAHGPAGPVEVRAELVVAADGRDSTMRDAAGLEVDDLGVPIDVLWFRLSRTEEPPTPSLAYFRRGRMVVTLPRGEYWQCGFVIGKGKVDELRAAGLEHFRRELAEMIPFAASSVGELRDWEQLSLLTVQVNRLRRWHRDGLLCIGDAAHAMSPAGGVGINLAIQDAVATANLLATTVRTRRPTTDELARVQARREWPAKATQAVQVFIHRRMFGPDAALRLPWVAWMLLRFAPTRRLAARGIGIGVRAEHVESPEASRHVP